MGGLDEDWLDRTLARIARVRVGVFGDFCLDAYWHIDPDPSELSVETHLPVRRVRQQRYSLGGAGNVAANLGALGVANVYAVGLIGEDLFGQLMRNMLEELKIDTSGLLSWPGDWQTPVFGKPYVGDTEQNRIDFGAFNHITPAAIDALAEQLDAVAGRADAVILNQQLPMSLSMEATIRRINQVVRRHAGRCRFVVDSRDRAEHYEGAILKVNAHEASRLLGEPRPLEERIGAAQAADMARRLHERTALPVFVTRGEHGMVAADPSGLHEIPGIQIVQPTDPVGAGDTAVSALAAVLGSGGSVREAAELANLAASITVRKLRTTGAASPREIRAIGPQPDYVYCPELADDPRQARYLEGSEIEQVRPLPDNLAIRHALFDHDGTVSTLRQGWEQIMEPMMVRAILGRRYQDADEGLYHKVVQAARRFIDRTTGVQTLAQMQHLVELVRQFGCVSADQVLDMHGYKALYDEALLAMVRARVQKLRRGELSPEDFQIKGAAAMLKALAARGVKLYLASGTDQADVQAEAAALGYADLFEGRIFGAVGDVTVEAKKLVIERILREHGLGGAALATFGDGPVEMRETRKRGGLAVGVASDELRRFGLNSAKRSRLIRAGADLVVPDFTQARRLLSALGFGN
jgi:rfaE bifunctional protein kinase chain/domain